MLACQTVLLILGQRLTVSIHESGIPVSDRCAAQGFLLPWKSDRELSPGDFKIPYARLCDKGDNLWILAGKRSPGRGTRSDEENLWKTR